MIKHLDSTTSAKIANALIDIRKEAGAATTGAVLTLVIETDERHQKVRYPCPAPAIPHEIFDDARLDGDEPDQSAKAHHRD